jgi:pimeloyl-ACP methyl ester carboxylesterase
MANIVLVHGAWHGAWCYRDTAKALRRRGHDVYTPTHTGVGSRFHLSAETITLETHVRDVLGCIEAEELTDVVLCGHSYGGMVITCVADRIPEQIRSLVYIDAFVPEDGETLVDLIRKSLPADVAPLFIDSWREAARHNHCGMVRPITAECSGSNRRIVTGSTEGRGRNPSRPSIRRPC